ncbi:MAG: PIN domain-containing protein [Actinobacteria bacterium]|nr:PIN domain-containing protein [Actinomycetota bacterium]
MSAIDSSVCIAALLAWHELHDVCANAARDAVIPAHALLETYSVLTRLPPPHRLDGGQVASLLRTRFPVKRILTASVALQRHLMHTLDEASVTGGAVYDALIALTVKDHGESLVTCDARALSTYAKLDVDVWLVGSPT